MTAPSRRKPPTAHQMRGVALDVIDAARDPSGYPSIVDRGAEPGVVMAVAAAVVRAAARESDCGAEWLLTMARDGLVDGVREGTTTRHEARVGTALLELADPRRPAEVVFDRAIGWSLTRGWMDTLDVISSAVDMLKFAASLSDDPAAFLDGLAAQLPPAPGDTDDTITTTKGEGA